MIHVTTAEIKERQQKYPSRN